MTILVMHHRVREFGAWKTVFDGHQAVRERHGVTRHWVYQGVDDPNDVTVAMEFPTVDSAKGFVEEPSLAEAMQRAGVDGEPGVHLRTEVESVTY